MILVAYEQGQNRITSNGKEMEKKWKRKGNSVPTNWMESTDLLQYRWPKNFFFFFQSFLVSRS